MTEKKKVYPNTKQERRFLSKGKESNIVNLSRRKKKRSEGNEFEDLSSSIILEED